MGGAGGVPSQFPTPHSHIGGGGGGGPHPTPSPMSGASPQPPPNSLWGGGFPFNPALFGGGEVPLAALPHVPIWGGGPHSTLFYLGGGGLSLLYLSEGGGSQCSPPPPHAPLWGGGCDPILHRSIWGGVRFSPPSLYPSGGGSPRSHPRAIPVHPCSVWGGELPYIPPQLLIGVAPVLSHQHPFVRWFGGGGIKFHSTPHHKKGTSNRGGDTTQKDPRDKKGGATGKNKGQPK